MCLYVIFEFCVNWYLVTAVFLIILGLFAHELFITAPQEYFGGSVVCKIRSNSDLTESVVLTFKKPGRYQVAFLHPKYSRGPRSLNANQTKWVRNTPEQMVITDSWLPKPITVVITYENKTESRTLH